MKQFLTSLTFVIVILVVLWSCGTEDKKNESKSIEKEETKKEANFFEIFSNKNLFTCGDTIVLSLHYEKKPDSVRVYLDGSFIGSLESFDKYVLNTKNLRTGYHQLMFINKYDNLEEEIDSYNFELLSDVIPIVSRVEVVDVFPHDKQAYTQGLFYEDGFLYEGTGQWGQSSLRKIKLKTYEIIQSYNLPDDIFGEGIVLYRDKIIQLTWQSRKAFVYDKNSFRLREKITYETEGWGITNYGDSLIMSDGSNVLYVVDPENFIVLDKIEVYDNKGKVTYLNELENINGLIYANVYQTDTIVVIDPKLGKVLKKIDCSGLLDENDKFPGIDVLNGIAYDKKTGKIFITGKNWPKLFEVKM